MLNQIPSLEQSENEQPGAVAPVSGRGRLLRSPLIGSLAVIAACGVASACGDVTIISADAVGNDSDEPVEVDAGGAGAATGNDGDGDGDGDGEEADAGPGEGEEADAGPDDADEPAEITGADLRVFIDEQLENGIEALIVPDEEDIPTTLLDDGEPDPKFITTEAKRYLGKQLFNDPIRTANIREEFGGVPETAQTASCGSCHLGEFTGKAGEIQGGSLGFEGKGFTDAEGNFFARRRVLPELTDLAPTLTQVLDEDGNITINGQADAIDAVQRLVPSMIGFAFNNRLLSFGIAGEPGSPENPDDLPAQESLAQITQTVHRMFDAQEEVLQENDVYVRLFQEAYPEEYAEAVAAGGDASLFINNDTILRAVASFLRTVATRNSPWDNFLGGDDDALTAQQLRGAKLFFTEASEGGAGCFSCHSGPQLNKQAGDELGVGTLVDENFYNIGLNDHPLQALAQEAFEDPEFRDLGRFEVTRDEDDVFEFRTPHLRNLKEHGQFMHSGSFETVREVVEYFNAGVA